MFNETDLAALIDLAGILPIENGWQIVIRAEVVDKTDQQPHGLDYAILLQDESGARVLGFDNAHSYDGASEEEPWDHEHKVGKLGQAFKYEFSSAGQLITDFFDRLKNIEHVRGIELNFAVDDNE
jgi:hypothetical protein